MGAFGRGTGGVILQHALAVGGVQRVELAVEPGLSRSRLFQPGFASRPAWCGCGSPRVLRTLPCVQTLRRCCVLCASYPVPSNSASRPAPQGTGAEDSGSRGSSPACRPCVGAVPSRCGSPFLPTALRIPLRSLRISKTPDLSSRARNRRLTGSPAAVSARISRARRTLLERVAQSLCDLERPHLGGSDGDGFARTGMTPLSGRSTFRREGAESGDVDGRVAYARIGNCSEHGVEYVVRGWPGQ